MGLQRYNRCIFYCKKALKYRKGYADAFYWMGNAFVSLRKPEHAETAYRKAVGNNPVYGRAWYNRGLVLHYELGRVQEAAKCYHEALQIDPGLAGIKRHKALAEMQAGDDTNENNRISR
jgi:tetratricopeptide (TPR) repeat protein